MDDLTTKKATRNMILFLFIILLIGGLLVAYSMNFLSGKKSVSISCSDYAVLNLLKSSLIKSNPHLDTAKISFNSSSTLENINNGKHIKCRTSAEIILNDSSEINKFILDYNSTLSDDNASLIVISDNITKID